MPPAQNLTYPPADAVLLPPPDLSPAAEARRNNALIARIAALHPANSAETDLAASRAESREAEGRSA